MTACRVDSFIKSVQLRQTCACGFPFTLLLEFKTCISNNILLLHIFIILCILFWHSADEETGGESGPLHDKKWLVFQSCLLQLFSKCPKCSGPCRKRLSRPFGGTMLQVLQSCRIPSCGHTRYWRI